MGDAVSVQVAIVAGAGGALGYATTVTLAAGGLTVAAVDRNEHALRELPDSVRPEVADTTDPAAAKSLVDRIAGEVGPPDVLVNTIGAFRPEDALTAKKIEVSAPSLVNHQDPVTTFHLAGGEPGPVAKACTAARGRAPRFQGDTVTSPATGATGFHRISRTGRTAEARP